VVDRFVGIGGIVDHQFQAGIPEEQLIIALESEAAAIYCERFTSDSRNKRRTDGFSMGKKGTKFMMVDVGGNILID
jgi:hypothetical protein